ncbi:hypothetical protein CsSME_00046573 [Camellia sinensis var. sinensis]
MTLGAAELNSSPWLKEHQQNHLDRDGGQHAPAFNRPEGMQTMLRSSCQLPTFNPALGRPYWM